MRARLSKKQKPATVGKSTHRANLIIPGRYLGQHIRVPLALRLDRSHKIANHDAVDARPVLARAHREVRHEVAFRLRV